MSTAAISLIVLFLAIIIGFWRKMNVGLVAILAAVIFSSFIGETDAAVIKGFSSSLFIMLLGVSFLCAVGITNGSLELLAGKALNMTGGRAIAAPVMLYIIGFGIAAIGPGCVPALGIAAALSLPLSKTTGYSATMLAIIGEMGGIAGRFSPITPESALIRELAEAQDIYGYEGAVLIYTTCTTLVLAVLVFFWFTKVLKETGSRSGTVPEGEGEQEALRSFDKNQILTLFAFLIVIIGSAFFGRNVGLLAFACGIFLVMIGAADEKKVFQSISWSTLLMVTGFGMLMNIVINVGGVELLSKGLASIMTPRTAIAIQGFTAGVMSWFSSAIGVVWPTLIPTVGGIADSVGVSPVGLISIMCMTASFAGLSPASTGGGLIMAANAADPDFDKEKENRLFIRLFGISAACLVLIVIAALIGVYNLF